VDTDPDHEPSQPAMPILQAEIEEIHNTIIVSVDVMFFLFTF